MQAMLDAIPGMGVDRSRLKDGRAIEEQAIFDSAVFNP